MDKDGQAVRRSCTAVELWCPSDPISRVVYLTDVVSGCESRSVISCWYLVIFRSLAFLMFSMLLPGMVGSKIVRSEPETITRSGLSDEVERFIGIVADGLLQALRPGRSA